MKNYIDKLALVDIKNKKVLMAKSFNKDVWFNPGGKREEDETDEQALIREIKEEMSVAIIPETITFYGTFEAQAHGKPEGTMVRLTCYAAEYEGAPQPTAEVEKLEYLGYDQRDQTSAVGKLFFDNLKSKGFVE